MLRMPAQVKGLLENGTFLHRAMLVEVLRTLQDFCKSTGIWKHNRCEMTGGYDAVSIWNSLHTQTRAHNSTRHMHVNIHAHRYLLSVLTFISKCAAVPEPDFEALVHEHELSCVVYNAARPPSLAAAAEAAAQAQENLTRRWVLLVCACHPCVGWVVRAMPPSLATAATAAALAH